MLLTYWRIHILYTIPATTVASFFLNPLVSKRNLFTIAFHVSIATLYTFPWDSYIIHNHAWTYPEWAVMYTLKKVPIEEVFFFMIQSTFTAQLFLLLGMFDTPSQHLMKDTRSDASVSTSSYIRKVLRWGPLAVLPALCITGWRYAIPETHGFYLGCIAWWITPIMTFLWGIAGDHFLSRWKTSLLSILIPTLYLCAVDTIALRAGTWHITERTSTGIFVVPDLPLEEAVFFLVTNTLLVCGMNAFDRSYAVIDVFGDLLAADSTKRPQAVQPSQLTPYEFMTFLVKSLLLRLDRLPASYRARIPAFEETQKVLAVHSRSFHTASYIFPSAVRRDLVILYAFCRVLDDFCDESATQEEARRLIDMSKEYLDLLYSSTPASSTEAASYTPPFAPIPSTFDVSAFLHKRVPKDAQSAFFLVSTICTRIPRYPFDDLIAGYEWDLRGQPIVTQEDLVEYSRLVASSVAEMCVWAMWANEPHSGAVQNDPRERKEVLAKAASMGVALQITNIARDIREDATKGRIYIPQDWFKPSAAATATAASSEKADAASAEKGKLSEAGIEERARLADYANLVQAAHGQRFPTPTEFRYHVYVRQLLALAEAHKAGTAAAIRKLPRSCRPGIRAATQVYIGIGDEIRKVAFKADGSGNEEYDGRRISLTKWQRVRIALKEVYLRR